MEAEKIYEFTPEQLEEFVTKVVKRVMEKLDIEVEETEEERGE